MLELLVTKLEEITDIHHHLLHYADKKQNAIIERNIDELNNLVQEESQLVKRVNQLENERIQLVKDIAGVQQDQSFRIMISEIPDVKMRESILKQITTLQQLMEELQVRNNINEQLLKDALSFVQQMINQVTKSKNNQYNYQSPGSQQPTETGGRGFFDTRA